MKRRVRPWVRALPLIALCVALPSHALYKVIAPNGAVTYTDTLPAASNGSKVIKLGENAAAAPRVDLPVELRQAAARYPVTLYTMKVCDPCDQARQLLRQRGVPFDEKLVVTSEDGDELARLSGGRDMPTLSIGAQVLRGLAPDSWNTYLDSAGYPRESKLPPNFQYSAATPLTQAPTLQAPVSSAERSTAPEAARPPPPSPTGIKF